MIALVEQKKQEAIALCRQFKVERLDLFGSAASGNFRDESSDLDFVVRFGDSIAAAQKLWAKYADGFKPEPVTPDAVSLTTGKPTARSSAISQYPARLANDGMRSDTDHYWATDVQRDPAAWWQVDLEKPTTVGRVVVVCYFGDNRHYGFTVEVSNDGQRWDMVADRRDNKEASTEEGYTCKFTARSARYIRVTQPTNSANTGRHLVEVMAYER
jgi:hypothetical protein